MKREEILDRITEIDAELKRRARDEQALKAYNTGKKKHKKQLAFHRCKSATGGYSGGTGLVRRSAARWRQSGCSGASTLTARIGRMCSAGR